MKFLNENSFASQFFKRTESLVEDKSNQSLAVSTELLLSVDEKKPIESVFQLLSMDST